MSRIQYSTSIASILYSLLDRFAQTGTLNYCLICLRTERRLVKNRAFKKFRSAMKLDKRRWQHHQICYMCERQASNALKFFKAATFAAAIDTIFTEVIHEKKNNPINVFHIDTFNSILEKFGLNQHEAAREWGVKLEDIRKSSQLIETQPLVVDNLHSNMRKMSSTQRPATPDELYVIPDAPPLSRGKVTGTATRCKGVVQLQPNNTKHQSMKEDTMKKRTGRNDDAFLLGSSKPKISETIVIMDDEEEEKEPLPILIRNVRSTADLPEPSEQPSEPVQPSEQISQQPSEPEQPSAQTSLTPSSSFLWDQLSEHNTTQPTLINPSKAVIRVALESLLEKPKEIYTGHSLLVGNPGENLTLHPIAIKEGVMTIPSLDAKLIDGKLVFNNLPQLTLTPGIIKQLKNPIENSKEINYQYNVSTNMDLVTTPQNAENNTKTIKRESSGDELATQNKIPKGLPVIEDSTTDKSSRIDWEDKIPMDVISYVDAVDPNRDPRIGQRGRPKKYCVNVKLPTCVKTASDSIELC